METERVSFPKMPTFHKKKQTNIRISILVKIIIFFATNLSFIIELKKFKLVSSLYSSILLGNILSPGWS